ATNRLVNATGCQGGDDGRSPVPGCPAGRGSLVGSTHRMCRVDGAEIRSDGPSIRSFGSGRPSAKFRSIIPAFLSVALVSAAVGEARRGYSIPMLDLGGETSLFTTVEKRDVYLGHPPTVLFRDGKTLLVAYPDGHGRGN